MKKRILLPILLLLFILSCSHKDILTPVNENIANTSTREVLQTYFINQTFLGNETRTFYGNEAPSNLNIKWRYYLGGSTTRVGSEHKKWYGAGWTGQPLMLMYKGKQYIIQGAYDHNLKKIDVKTGALVSQLILEDAIKGTGTLWMRPRDSSIFILQGSRIGETAYLSNKIVNSYRCVDFKNMKRVWRYNSARNRSYSRDVDGSALIINDTAYLGLENGLFIVFDPDPDHSIMVDGILQPKIYDIDTIFFPEDIKTHGGNLVTESSPSYLNGHIYISSGSGHVFGYNIAKKEIDWFFTTGADMDGTPVVTSDSCLLISIEKEYIPGDGGVMKLDPSQSPEDAVVWFFPTGTQHFEFWDGGVIGSVAVNDMYNKENKYTNIAVFTGIDEYLYVVDYKEIECGETALGPQKKKYYPKPKLLFKYHTGPSISTPLIIKNKIIAATYKGVYLFEFDDDMNFKLLEYKPLNSFESTPFVWDKRIYVASRDGYLYCFGD